MTYTAISVNTFSLPTLAIRNYNCLRKPECVDTVHQLLLAHQLLSCPYITLLPKSFEMRTSLSHLYSDWSVHNSPLLHPSHLSPSIKYMYWILKTTLLPTKKKKKLFSDKQQLLEFHRSPAVNLILIHNHNHLGWKRPAKDQAQPTTWPTKSHH